MYDAFWLKQKLWKRQLRLDGGAADTGQGSPRIAFALLTAGAPSDFRKMQLAAENRKVYLLG